MSADQITITEEEFEDWLAEICPIFIGPTAVNSYFIPLSSHVRIFVRIHGSATGAYHIVLQNCLTGRIFQVGGESGYRVRTENWKSDWKGFVDFLISRYAENVSFYDRTPDQYASEYLSKIESVKDWQSFPILKDLHKTLSEGRALTVKQEQAIERFSRSSGNRNTKPAPVPALKESRSPARSLDLDNCLVVSLFDATRILKSRAQEERNDWLDKFCDSVLSRVRRGKNLSPKQEATLIHNLSNRNIKFIAT
jgi:hypothetical protein